MMPGEKSPGGLCVGKLSGECASLDPRLAGKRSGLAPAAGAALWFKAADAAGQVSSLQKYKVLLSVS